MDKTCLVVVDVQGKLAQLMEGKERLFQGIETLIKAFTLLDLPILWCQQCPDALGPTVESIRQALGDRESIDKSTFSCWADPVFHDRLAGLNCSNVVLCGIEAHICIYQTARDLNALGYHVEVPMDAVSARSGQNLGVALGRLRAEGMTVASVEMVLFDLLKTAQHPKFREISRLIK